ncbi:hypothetical protein RFI_00135 [Reticulomyxa filosa]|uniref:non-specific serine/threonine protein kinase n=1 Tax=Reticulomyxa filosa TaxID=46433 RepID=X6PFY3_RETFI|nr:hypothetical protein RFI_00135 [Reticulomyxa filosa]|eukprot:ETO36929.1 hypothetical protein RFI_00135 [Reticulomyxa filosa]
MEAAQDEIELLLDVRQAGGNNVQNVVQMLNSFAVKKSIFVFFLNKKDMVFVFEVLGENLLEFIKWYNYRGLPLAVVKKIAREVLQGLDFLHRQCDIIHTDLKPENVLFTRIDPICRNDLEKSKIYAFRNQFQRQLNRLEKELSDASMKGTNIRQIESIQQKIKEWKDKIELVERQLPSDEIRSNHMAMNSKLIPSEKQNQAKYPLKEPEKPLKPLFEVSRLSKSILFIVVVVYIHGWNVVENKPYDSNEKKKQVTPIVKIADLGNACWTHKHFTEEITTRQYRAPESILVFYFQTIQYIETHELI